MSEAILPRMYPENFKKLPDFGDITPPIETSERCREELARLRDLTDDESKFKVRDSHPGSKYESVFGDRYHGFSNGQKVDVQYYTGDNNEKALKVTTEEDGNEVKKEIMARMWVTDISKKPPAALCYELTPDGNWYMSASDTYKKGDKDNNMEGYNVWKLKKAEKVTREDTELNVFDRLSACNANKVKAA